MQPFVLRETIQFDSSKLKESGVHAPPGSVGRHEWCTVCRHGFDPFDGLVEADVVYRAVVGRGW